MVVVVLPNDPELVEIFREMLRDGWTPEQIEKWLTRWVRVAVELGLLELRSTPNGSARLVAHEDPPFSDLPMTERDGSCR